MTLQDSLIENDKPESLRVSDAHVADAVARHRTLLTHLAEMGARQRELTRSGDGEALLTLLTMRASIVRDIQAQAERLSEIARAATCLPPAERATLDEELLQLDDLTALAVARDEQDRQSLIEARDRVSQELREISTNRRAAAAYVPAASSSPRIQDSRG